MYKIHFHLEMHSQNCTVAVQCVGSVALDAFTCDPVALNRMLADSCDSVCQSPECMKHYGQGLMSLYVVSVKHLSVYLIR